MNSGNSFGSSSSSSLEQTRCVHHQRIEQLKQQQQGQRQRRGRQQQQQRQKEKKRGHQPYRLDKMIYL